MGKAVLLAALVAVATAGSGLSQGLDGPQEQPPAGFAGQQFVDSRGCVFLRAGYGGQAVWVQRLDTNRSPICGYAPTVAGAAALAGSVQPAPALPAPIVAAPVLPAPIVPAPIVTEAPQVDAAVPVADAQPVPASPVPVAPAAAKPPKAARSAPRPAASGTRPAITPRKIGCFRSAPVPQVVTMQDGRAVVVCTPGIGVQTGWRSPIYPDGVEAAVPVAPVAPPRGYVAAWKDDRLNPYRAQGTPQGQLQQEAIWTNQVPSRPVKSAANAPVTQRAISPVAIQPTTQPTTQASAGGQTRGAFVQIGVFGMPANALGAIARLSAMGLTAQEAPVSIQGRALRSVYAGPFQTGDDASRALAAVRAAGFADAFIR